MTTKSYKKVFIENVIGETLAYLGFVACLWIGLSWIGVIAEQPLADWNFFKILISIL